MLSLLTVLVLLLLTCVELLTVLVLLLLTCVESADCTGVAFTYMG